MKLLLSHNFHNVAKQHLKKIELYAQNLNINNVDVISQHCDTLIFVTQFRIICKNMQFVKNLKFRFKLG